MTFFAAHVPTGNHAGRPGATTVPEGTLYSCTDHGKVYKSDGVVWGDWHDPADAPIGTHTHDIVDLPTAETDTALVLAPDGAGGVEFRAETGGGGGSVTDDVDAAASLYNFEHFR